jgi:hypothetical protein
MTEQLLSEEFVEISETCERCFLLCNLFDNTSVDELFGLLQIFALLCEMKIKGLV